MTAGEGGLGKQSLAPGLYVVATPIGNLEDVTLRALRVLRQADLIACEDTRHTQKLLNHYQIATQTISYHEHNEAARASELIARLKNGARIALVTDAGMPGISDPGFRVISLAIANGVLVVPIPGATALVAALAGSGLPTDKFRFAGFLPAKQGERRKVLETIRSAKETQIFYEAPHRVAETIEDIVNVLGAARTVVVAREVSKVHEEFLRGTAIEVIQALQSSGEIKGEITLLIGKAADAGPDDLKGQAAISERLNEIMTADKLDEKAALKKVARERGISKSEAYREWQKSKP